MSANDSLSFHIDFPISVFLCGTVSKIVQYWEFNIWIKEGRELLISYSNRLPF